MVAETFVLAAAQTGPVYGDKEATVDRTCDWITRAGDAGADLVVFPETHIPGFPYWRTSPPRDEWLDLMVSLQRNSVQTGDEAIQVIGDAAADANVNVVLGANELDDRPGSETVYNSLFFFDRAGEVLGRHRKLVPTHAERTIWGRGDPSSLGTYDLDIGRLGGLVCYENHMTLSKAALAAMGEEIHAATWSGFWTQHRSKVGVKGRGETPDAIETSDIYPAMREYAFETQSFVVSCSPYMPSDVLEETLGYDPELNVATGGSMLLDPVGVVREGPVLGEEALLTTTFERDDRRAAKAIFDAMGHYARWDAVSLDVSGASYDPITEPEKPQLSPARVETIAEEYEIPIDAVETVAEAVRQSMPR